MFPVGSNGCKGRSEIGNENRQLNQYENQNRRLKDALEDHQFALELIMSKYRQQLSKWVKMRQKERFKLSNNHNLEVLQKSSSRVNEMQRIMREAINLDETNSVANEEIVAQLKTENETLRHLLRIAINFGSISEKLIPLPLLKSLKKEQAIENEKVKDAQKKVFPKAFGVNLSVQPLTIKTFRKLPIIEELKPILNKQQAM
jgi:FGFR1 oncogene partner 2 homolog